jgi:hypothetical protein
MAKRTQTGKLEEKPIPSDGPMRPDQLLQLKIQATEALGLMEKVSQVGWGGLTAKETGSIGGFMSRIRKAEAGGQHNETSE